MQQSTFRSLMVGSFAGALAFFSVDAAAHIRLLEPAQRYVYTQDGQKQGPCGEGTPSNQVTTYLPGETITVTWQETINHPGHFRISLDPDGGEDDLVDPTDYDDFYAAPSVLADDIADPGGSSFTHEITLPMEECAKCTLQLIQVMTDKPPWGPEGGNELYYWCADIAISSTGPTTTGATTTTGSGAGGDSGGDGGANGDGSSDGSADEGCTIRGGADRLPVSLVLAGTLAMLGALRRRRR
jgi:hypothetical protein